MWLNNLKKILFEPVWHLEPPLTSVLSFLEIFQLGLFYSFMCKQKQTFCVTISVLTG